MSDIISQQRYPWITFKLRGQDYCISSEKVFTMMMPGQLHSLPEAGADAGILGLMTVGKEPVPVVSVRALLGLPLLQEDLDKFSEIEHKHSGWIAEFEECVASGISFTLPLDIHGCELGLWHDGFHTNNYNLKRLSEQLAEPHARLHERARELLEQRARGVDAKASPLLQEALNISKREILPLLKKLDGAYRDTNRGIVIVLEQGEQRLGLQVDRIMSVMTFEHAQRTPYKELGLGREGLVQNIIMGVDNQLFLELNPVALGACGGVATV